MKENENYIILKVGESLRSDVGYGRARIDEFTRNKLRVAPGDIVEIIGKTTTSCIVWRGLPEDENMKVIRIDGITRKNAGGVSIGDKVKVAKCKVLDAQQVVLGPIVRDFQRVKFGEGVNEIIRRGILGRPVVVGDTIVISGIALFGENLPFSVITTMPRGTVRITDRTQIIVREESAKEPLLIPRISYEDIGGLKEELQKVREMIELPLKHPELFERLGIEPPKGILLHGPPGTGKTLIAKAVANESGANFYSIAGPEIMSKFYGESEKKLREIFEQGEKTAPSIIFIDEIDSIAPKREEVVGEVERRVVAQLLTLMDGLKSRGKIIVIGATNIPDSLDPALRRPGRFDREIALGVPDINGRKEILQVHTRNMPLSKDFNIDYLANVTHGFVGADLAALAKEAAMRALRKQLPKIDLDLPIPTEVLENLQVTLGDFKDALKDIEPSAMREVFTEIPAVKWSDIGGLENIKKRLQEAVNWPLKYPEIFRRLGIKPPRGILLYGPPGTGKTLLAKAVATESESNFISVRGPELISKWVGESEKGIREIFKKAKQVAPAVVFFDEIDAIAARRMGEEGEGRVGERVVNQLLTSMDGLERIENVVVIAATNRPDILDRALLRAGRFDWLLYVPHPDVPARLEILKVHTKNMPLSVDVNLNELAEKTDGYVGADIEALCRETALIVLRKNMNANKINKADIEEALKTVRPSVTKNVISFYENIVNELESGKLKKERVDYYYR